MPCGPKPAAQTAVSAVCGSSLVRECARAGRAKDADHKTVVRATLAFRQRRPRGELGPGYIQIPYPLARQAAPWLVKSGGRDFSVLV
jgi:hypothetical protein